jgi:hypothetical protein
VSYGVSLKQKSVLACIRSNSAATSHHNIDPHHQSLLLSAVPHINTRLPRHGSGPITAIATAPCSRCCSLFTFNRAHNTILTRSRQPVMHPQPYPFDNPTTSRRSLSPSLDSLPTFLSRFTFSPPASRRSSSSSASVSPPTRTSRLPSASSLPITLRPRRRSGQLRLARCRPLQLVLALSIPLLALLLANEWRIHETIAALPAHHRAARRWEHADVDARALDLARLRRSFGTNRRKEVVAERTPQHHQSRSKRSETQLAELELGWGPADEQALQAAVSDHWPDWWGDADIVGPSPFDHRPSETEDKRRILFLTGEA